MNFFTSKENISKENSPIKYTKVLKQKRKNKDNLRKSHFKESTKLSVSVTKTKGQTTTRNGLVKIQFVYVTTSLYKKCLE
jgi:hypothetical protein